MAISRHKVLSEMQQQLELASSKCGNLQKQLEIVKDKVRQSSTTNLVQKEPRDEKENKTKNGETLRNLGETERNQEYQHVMSLSSSSTEDVNEERDVNIIKVFYDRLGQMDYPAGHVELSDISSEENDLDIDQLLSSVNFSISNNEKIENEKRKEKRSDKKAKEKTQKRKKAKGKTQNAPLTSPYESHLTKMTRQSPLKNRNQRNKTNVRPSIDSHQSALGSATQKPISRGQISKTETEKPKKRRQASGGTGALTKNSGKQVFQEPIRRIINLASELRKTKSSTGEEKKDIFTDTRSLTMLHSNTSPGKTQGARQTDKVPDKSVSKEDQGQNALEMVKNRAINRGKHVVAPCKGPVRVIPTRKEVKLKKEAPPQVNKIMKDKGTSLSDLAKVSVGKKTQDPENNVTTTIAPDTAKTATNANKIVQAIVPVLKINNVAKVASKSAGGKVSTTAVADKKTKPEVKVGTLKNHVVRPKIGEPNRIENNKDADRNKNGINPHLLSATEDKVGKSDVRRKVNLFENTVPKDKNYTDMFEKGGVNERSSKSRGTALTITRTNSRGTLYEESSRVGHDELQRFPSVNNLPPVLPVIRGEPKEKENADISPLTISQIRRMKDNLMKFNAIPFIVGQSTTKSYHIGLNIQQTYSLFKQTPSMTALKVSRFADNDQHSTHSRGRSTKTGYTGRSLSTLRGRETCPACGPAPDPSPEQLADPWAVPQDDDGMAIRVCTCLPKRIISFDQVLNQLYFTDMNLIKLHPSLLPSKDGAIEENEDIDGREKSASLPHRGTNTLYYTKLLRSIQNLKDNILG